MVKVVDVTARIGVMARRPGRGESAVAAALVVLVTTCAPLPAAADSSGGTPRTSSPAGSPASLQHLVDALVDAGSPGATMLVRDGDQTRTYSAGVSDARTERTLDPEDRFRVGSITK